MENIQGNLIRNKKEKPNSNLIEKLDLINGINHEKTLVTVDGGIWIEIKDKEKNVLEGKLFLSENNINNSITVVIPGMLGDINKKIEESWKDELLELGDLFVARHNGLSVKSQKTRDIINCPEKEVSNWDFTGEKEKKYSPVDYVKEPETAVNVFSYIYKKIQIVSHSFGSFEVAHMLGANVLSSENIKKINKWVSLSGWTSKDPASGVKTDYEVIYNSWLDEIKNLGILNIIQENKQFLNELSTLFNKIVKIPEEIMVVIVSPTNDEVLNSSTGKNLQEIATHALLINDETEGADKFGMVHDFGHLKILPRLLKMEVCNKHSVTTKK